MADARKKRQRCDFFPGADVWYKMYETRHRESKAPKVAEVSCPICMDDKKVARSVFVETGFACLSCTDGVACRECATQMIARRKNSESFNTVRCPMCRKASHTYECLECGAPTRPGYSATLVREAVGIDRKMISPIKKCETIDVLMEEIVRVLKMVQTQCRVRLSLGHPISPCAQYFDTIKTAVYPLGTEVARPLSEAKEIVLGALRGLWPLLRWTSVIGTVCSNSDACARKFTKCVLCKFLFRSSGGYIVAEAGRDAMCVLCSGQYPSLE